MDKNELLEYLLSEENIDMQNAAYLGLHKTLVSERGFTDLGRGFSYPFGQNQAEWEAMLFIRGWNAAIRHMKEERT